MKQAFTLLLFSLLAGSLQAQIYVNEDASGANDGTSWANAFTDLSTAIHTTNPGDELWIASGTYKPPSPDLNVDTAFSLPHDLILLGGFAGDESSVDDRDPQSNRTILTADQNGDDIPNDYDQNKADNNRHVMWLTDTITQATLIDGLIFQNGITAPADGSGNERRGGGVLCYGSPRVNNCTFRQNWGHFGGGFYPRGAEASATVLSNCIFERNAGFLGGGMYITASGVTISNCSFENNEVIGSGGAMYNNSENGSIISNSLFEGNRANAINDGGAISRGDGGAIYLSNSLTVLSECEFLFNYAEDDGGAITIATANPSINNCIFDGNEAIDRGGAIYNISANPVFTNCQFNFNNAFDGRGGAVTNSNFTDVFDSVEVQLYNCIFEGNFGQSGGGLASFGELTTCSMRRCIFSENTGTFRGGGIYVASGSTLNIDSTLFTLNEGGDGAALASLSDNGEINIDHSEFDSNASSDFGGAINVSGAGAINDTVSLTVLNIQNSIIRSNIAAQQGGGINLNNADANISSVLIAENTCLNGDAVGAGISINAGDSTQVSVNILNSTIADNAGSLFAGIAHFTTENESFSELTMQNTIVANAGEGDNYTIEDGTPTFVSLGGNLFDDDTADDYLVMTDQSDADPMFLGNGDYNITNDSPAKDNGIADGAPATDILGNPRVGNVDIGAYENQILISNKEYLLDEDVLSIAPNPVVDQELIFTLEGNLGEQLKLQVLDMNGSVRISQVIQYQQNGQEYQIDLAGFVPGIYALKLSDGEKVTMKNFVKF